MVSVDRTSQRQLRSAARGDWAVCMSRDLVVFFVSPGCACTCQMARVKQLKSQAEHTWLEGEPATFPSVFCVLIWSSGHSHSDVILDQWRGVVCKPKAAYKICLRQNEKQTVHQGQQNTLLLSPVQLQTLEHSLTANNRKIEATSEFSFNKSLPILSQYQAVEIYDWTVFLKYIHH